MCNRFLYSACIILFLFARTEVARSDSCRDHVLMSQPLQHSSVYIRDTDGNPARIKNVTLVEKFSQTDCVKWDSFAHVGSTVIAKDGCQGRFRVCYMAGVSPPHVPLTHYFDCVTVRLMSSVRQPDEKVVLRKDGRGDLIVSMDLLRTFSAVSCVPGLSYDFYGHKVEAKFGCKGEFRVCVDPLLILDVPPEESPLHSKPS